jgi:hypothetical protein
MHAGTVNLIKGKPFFAAVNEYSAYINSSSGGAMRKGQALAQ